MTWTATAERLPDLETPVLTVFNGECRILERRREVPGFEDTYQAFDYWDDPTDDGQQIDDYEVTHWMVLPGVPGAEPVAQVPASEEVKQRVARAIWNIRREDEDRCDLELEDVGRGHSVWREAEAALNACARRTPQPTDPKTP